jgi:nucleoside-diphosphate-sugar epimerase
MSRRRKLPPQPAGTVRVFTANVICTDRGQHPAALLGRVVDGRDVGKGEQVLFDNSRPAPVTDWRGDVDKTFHFACQRCGRDEVIREPNLLAAIDQDLRKHLGRAHRVVDVSRL